MKIESGTVQINVRDIGPLAVGEIVENIGQAWCLCPYEWGIDDYITVRSSQGQLALCAVGRVVAGPNRGKLRYEPLTKSAIHDLSSNTTVSNAEPSTSPQPIGH